MNVIEITDFMDPQLDVYARMSENELLNRHEPQKGLFIAESPKVIQVALDAGYEPVSMLMETKHVMTQGKVIIDQCPNIPVYCASLDILCELTGFKLTRGMLCAMKRKKLPSVQEVIKDAKRIAVLEDVMNPTNIGAIFRSAAALNMDAILLTNACSNPLYRRSIRVSMGTVFQIPWTFMNEMSVEDLHAFGFKNAAMALSDQSIPIDDKRLLQEEKLAVVLGTEGDGLASSTIAGCDYTVRIPMAHGVDSLNVAAASAVAFYQLTRKA